MKTMTPRCLTKSASHDAITDVRHLTLSARQRDYKYRIPRQICAKCSTAKYKNVLLKNNLFQIEYFEKMLGDRII